MQNLIQALTTYTPYNEQEARDRDMMLDSLAHNPLIFTRDSLLAHMSASAWVVNPTRDKVLMAYHNIYQSWSWLGGHADGETDLLAVALREAREESGLRNVRAVTGDIFSVEALTVDGHVKRGVYVPSHLHLNVTYLLEASERDALCVKPDENSGVRWFTPQDALAAVSERWMRDHIYRKLMDKASILRI